MPTRAEIIAKTSTLSRSETVELTEFLQFLKECFRESCADGEFFSEWNGQSELVPIRSYRCTPIIAESGFLLALIDSGAYLVHAMNAASSRKLVDVDFMYRKKPASRLSKTAAHCHVLSTYPLSLQIIDLSVFLGKSLLSESWEFRLRVAQVELKFPRSAGSVILEFAPRYRLSDASDALKQSNLPIIGLYIFRDIKCYGQNLVPVFRWIGSVEDDSEVDLFGKDNTDYQVANWIRTSPCPEPMISQFETWRDDVDKACFGADWLSLKSSPTSFKRLQILFLNACPDLEHPPQKKSAFCVDSR